MAMFESVLFLVYCGIEPDPREARDAGQRWWWVGSLRLSQWRCWEQRGGGTQVLDQVRAQKD